MKKWKKVRTIEIHDYNGYYQVERDEVVTPGGKPGEYSVVRGRPFSVIIPVDKNGQIYMVKQHRYTIDKISLELPAGMNDGQKPIEGAQRELEEETALVSDDWVEIGKTHEANGLVDIEASFFIAHDVRMIKSPRRDPKDKDVFEIEKYSIAEVKKMILDGTITDSPSVCAFAMALLQGRLKKYEKRE